jgi:hypothetical protein
MSRTDEVRSSFAMGIVEITNRMAEQIRNAAK